MVAPLRQRGIYLNAQAVFLVPVSCWQAFKCWYQKDGFFMFKTIHCQLKKALGYTHKVVRSVFFIG